MAIDPNILANYERDWGEALEQYDAALRAERMANVNYDPASRTFAASQPAGSAERLSQAFLTPVQMKYGPLMGGGGRAAAAPAKPRPVIVKTPDGVFERDWTTGAYRKVVDIPPKPAPPKMDARDAATYAVLKDQFAKMNADLMTASKPSPSVLRDRDAMAKAMADIEAKYAVPKAAAAPAAQAQRWQVDPSEIPYGTPGEPTGFIGTPGGENVFDPTARPVNAPFGLGASVRGGGPATQRRAALPIQEPEPEPTANYDFLGDPFSGPYPEPPVPGQAQAQPAAPARPVLGNFIGTPGVENTFRGPNYDGSFIGTPGGRSAFDPDPFSISEPSETAAPQIDAPSVGEVRKGYRFKGGVPSNKNNWEKVR